MSKLLIGTHAGDVERPDIPFEISSKHLRTHAFIVGMTGSGKTGLGIALLEELALTGTPALIIDPKGDLGNMCNVHDELPAGHPYDSGPLHNLADCVKRVIYTPGSTVGVPVNVLRSFAAPAPALMADREQAVERAQYAASSLLSLLPGVRRLRPVAQSLLSNILLHVWGEGSDVDLHDLVHLVVTPPFATLGALTVDEFMSRNDREKLSRELNSLLADPSFEIWMRGQPLDVGAMLGGGGGAQHSIFNIAHLDDRQRMFFVTLLLNELIAYMRSRPGSDDLEAVLYMDEIAGYLPPNGMPASKGPMLTLLKQARAFGIGVVLSTQNPVDMDYRAMSNCGLWFLGKLQTAQDCKRVAVGLEQSELSQGTTSGIEEALSGLGGREFLVNSTYDGLGRMWTRYCMSVLSGPLSREEISSLMEGAWTQADEVDRAIENLDKRMDGLLRAAQRTRGEIKALASRAKGRRDLITPLMAVFGRGLHWKVRAMAQGLEEPNAGVAAKLLEKQEQLALQVRELEMFNEKLESLLAKQRAER